MGPISRKQISAHRYGILGPSDGSVLRGTTSVANRPSYQYCGGHESNARVIPSLLSGIAAA